MELVSNYLIRAKDKWKLDLTNSDNTGFKMIPFIFVKSLIGPLCSTIQTVKEREAFKRVHEMNGRLRLLQALKWADRFDREKDIVAIKERVLLNDSPHKRDFESATAIVDFFKKQGYFIYDILIRCCSDITYIGNLYLPIIRYYELWGMIKKMGYLVAKPCTG